MNVLRPLVVSSIFVAMACRAAPAPEHRGPFQGSRVAGEAPRMNTVVMLDERVADAIGVERTGGQIQSTGSLRARALLLNRTEAALVVQARAVFFDQEAMPVDDTTAFKNVTLPPRAVTGVEFHSTSTQASQYVIEVGELR